MSKLPVTISNLLLVTVSLAGLLMRWSAYADDQPRAPERLRLWSETSPATPTPIPPAPTAAFDPYSDSALLEYWDWTTKISSTANGSSESPGQGKAVTYWAGGKGIANATVVSARGTLAAPAANLAGLNGHRALSFSSAQATALSIGRPS